MTHQVYALDKLMTETRRIAAEYYKATKSVLPVSSELAKYDACRFLNLSLPEKPLSGVDAIDASDRPIQIKSRVIFNEGKLGYRIGQINPEGTWECLLLVLMDKNYESYEIYQAERSEILEAVDGKNSNRLKRGAMSVAKFKMLSQLVWTHEGGLEV